MTSSITHFIERTVVYVYRDSLVLDCKIYKLMKYNYIRAQNTDIPLILYNAIHKSYNISKSTSKDLKDFPLQSPIDVNYKDTLLP
jgi:hypothetical protein